VLCFLAALVCWHLQAFISQPWHLRQLVAGFSCCHQPGIRICSGS
jgi:hypothetical protein